MKIIIWLLEEMSGILYEIDKYFKFCCIYCISYSNTINTFSIKTHPNFHSDFAFALMLKVHHWAQDMCVVTYDMDIRANHFWGWVVKEGIETYIQFARNAETNLKGLSSMEWASSTEGVSSLCLWLNYGHGFSHSNWISNCD